MTSTDSTLFDGADITKNDGEPTHKNLKYCRKELAAIFATFDCTIDEAKNWGHSFLAYTDLQWLSKTNITATVPIPVLLGEFIGSTHAEKYKHEQKFKQYIIFRKVDKAGVRLVQTIYNTIYIFRPAIFWRLTHWIFHPTTTSTPWRHIHQHFHNRLILTRFIKGVSVNICSKWYCCCWGSLLITI